MVVFREEQMQRHEMSLIINEDVSIRFLLECNKRAEVAFVMVRGLLSWVARYVYDTSLA